MDARRGRVAPSALALTLVVGIAIALTATPAAARADGPVARALPDPVVAFAPPPLPAPSYGIRPPSADAKQVRAVVAADGVSIATETWLPAPLAGQVPPTHLPVVVVYTPYATPGKPDAPEAVDLLVPRGYAVTFANVRGSGASGGCFGLNGHQEVDDGARLIEDAGTKAPWSSGSVGMYGGSYPGGTQIETATGPDRARLASLKALVVVAPSASMYDVFNHDGVPHLLAAPASTLDYIGALTSPTAGLAHLPERPGCLPSLLAGVADTSGDYTPFYEDRDGARRIDRLQAATLMVHGKRTAGCRR